MFYVRTDGGVSKRQQQFVQFAYSYVRNREEAEDIVMGLLLMYGSTGMSYRRIPNISALLLTAIKNRSLNHLQHWRYVCVPSSI